MPTVSNRSLLTTNIQPWQAILRASLVMLALNSLALAQAESTQTIADPELKQFLLENLSQQSKLKDKFDAEVWLLSMMTRMQPYRINDAQKKRILSSVYREAVNSQLEPELVLAVIAVESSFNRYAISSVGAQGLMQIMPFWKNEIGRSSDNLTQVETNIRYGCKILEFYLQREKGNLDRALARYNGSLGSQKYPIRVREEWSRRWQGGRL